MQTIGGTHFIDRISLLGFLDEMISANSVVEALNQKLAGADPPPKRKLLRITLPEDLRQTMMPDLPPNVRITPGRVEITGNSAETIVEALVTLAMAMQNDLARWEQAIAIPRVHEGKQDEELQLLFASLRGHHD